MIATKVTYDCQLDVIRSAEFPTYALSRPFSALEIRSVNGEKVC
jgi:hypothetical protein